MTDIQTAPSEPKAAVAFLKREASGRPYIQGLRCRACSALMTDERLACPACGSRTGFDAFEAAPQGVLQAYSIVRRSFPGVATPFVSAVVDLDDGLTLKGNLIGVEPEPQALTPGLRVRLVYGDALGRTDKEGSSYLAYFFEPAA